MTPSCRTCGIALDAAKWPARFCLSCRDKRSRGRAWAANVVSAAIKAGYLQRAIGQFCVDCGGPAKEYEHRDYSLPLAVEPICCRCNSRRGPGKWIPHGILIPGAKLYLSAYFHQQEARAA